MAARAVRRDHRRGAVALSEVVVCVSTSGRRFPDLDRRADVLELDGDLKPDMASLTLGRSTSLRQASVNEPAVIRGLAERMADRGIVPELEVFDLGMLDYARYLIDREHLRPPFYVNILLGSLGTLAASPFNLALASRRCRPDAVWAATGIGRFQLEVNGLRSRWAAACGWGSRTTSGSTTSAPSSRPTRRSSTGPSGSPWRSAGRSPRRTRCARLGLETAQPGLNGR